MAKLIQAQLLLFLEKLNKLGLDTEADMCETLHEDAEMLCMTLSVQLNALQDAVNGKNIDQ